MRLLKKMMNYLESEEELEDRGKNIHRSEKFVEFLFLSKWNFVCFYFMFILITVKEEDPYRKEFVCAGPILFLLLLVFVLQLLEREGGMALGIAKNKMKLVVR